jgi:hypothetical protein
MFRRIPGSGQHWARYKPGQNIPYVNQPATFLHLGCDPNVTEGMEENKFSWDWAPMKWQNRVGSVIIARKDKKPLLPEHAEVLADFCQHHLARKFGECVEGEHGVPESIPGLGKDHVLNETTNAKFLEYYNA